MARPKIETAALGSPGGARQVGEPPAELVEALAEWLGRDVDIARNALVVITRSYGRR